VVCKTPPKKAYLYPSAHEPGIKRFGGGGLAHALSNQNHLRGEVKQESELLLNSRRGNFMSIGAMKKAPVVFLLILLVLSAVSYVPRVRAANVDVGITSITVNPPNSITVPTDPGWARATITVIYHNYGSSAVNHVTCSLDYRGFSIAIQSEITLSPGDTITSYIWIATTEMDSSIGDAPNQIQASVSAMYDTDTDPSDNQMTIPYYVYVQSQYGTLYVDTTPVKGGVYVNGESWGTAPQSRSVQVGTYQVSFGSVSGYNTPSSQAAQVNTGQITSITGVYTPIESPPTSLDLKNYYLSSYSVKASESFTAYYSIYNPNSYSVTVWLGCSIRKSGSYSEITDSSHDKSVSVSPGTDWYSRTFMVPSGTSSDSYEYCLAIWKDQFVTQYDTSGWESGLTVLPQTQSSSISCSASPSSINLGQSIIISGSISPAHSATVTITYRWRDGGTSAWQTLTTVSSTSDGSYSYQWTPSFSATYDFYSSWSGDSDHNGATSPTATVTVNPVTAGNLVVTVYNINGAGAASLGGSTWVELYKQGTTTPTQTAYIDSGSKASFTNVGGGSYYIDVWHKPGSGLDLTEFWGQKTSISASGGSTTSISFTRNMPYVSDFKCTTTNPSLNQPLIILVKVTNPGSSTQYVKVSVHLKDPSGTEVIIPDTSSVSVSNGGSNSFEISYTPTKNGQYQGYAICSIVGGGSQTTDQWNWTPLFTISSGPTPPQPPSLVSPNDGATLTSTSVSFSWSSSSGATDYQIEINGPTYNLGSVSSTSYATTLSVGSYTWRVRAHNSAGWSAWTATWGFTISGTTLGAIQVAISYPSGSSESYPDTAILYDSGWNEKARQNPSSNTFTFSNLGPGTYNVEVYKDNMWIGDTENIQVSGQTVTRTINTLSKRTLTVTVYYSDGSKRFPSASVEVYTWDGTYSQWIYKTSSTTDNNGVVSFSLWPTSRDYKGEKYRLIVKYSGSQVGSQDPVTVNKDTGSSTSITTTQSPPSQPPSLTLYEPEIDGLTVTIDGVTTPGKSDTSITRIHWDWGDAYSEDQWFPATHTYSQAGTYTITVTSYQSDGLSTSKSKTVILQIISTSLTTSLDNSAISENTYTTVTITGRLTRTDTGAGVSGKTVSLSYSGGSIGASTTDGNGYYSYSWQNVYLVRGSYIISASFEGDDTYEASSNTATVTVLVTSTLAEISIEKTENIVAGDEIKKLLRDAIDWIPGTTLPLVHDEVFFKVNNAADVDKLIVKLRSEESGIDFPAEVVATKIDAHTFAAEITVTRNYSIEEQKHAIVLFFFELVAENVVGLLEGLVRSTVEEILGLVHDEASKGEPLVDVDVYISEVVPVLKNGTELEPKPFSYRLETVAQGIAKEDSRPLVEIVEDFIVDLVASNSNVLVTTSSGARVGALFENGVFRDVNEIPGAYYSGYGTHPQVIILPYSVGEYKIQIYAIEKGDVHLYVWAKDAEKQTFSMSEGQSQEHAVQISADKVYVDAPWWVVWGDRLMWALIGAMAAVAAVFTWRRRRKHGEPKIARALIG